jgi:hypothetical protein
MHSRILIGGAANPCSGWLLRWGPLNPKCSGYTSSTDRLAAQATFYTNIERPPFSQGLIPLIFSRDLTLRFQSTCTPTMHLSLMSRATTGEARIPIGAPHDPNAVLTIATLLSFTWVLVGLRSYCKSYVMKSFGRDDILMVLSLVSTQLFLQPQSLTVEQVFFSVYEIGYLNMHIILDDQSSLTKGELGVSTSVNQTWFSIVWKYNLTNTP